MRTFLLLSLAALALGASARAPGLEERIAGGVEAELGEANYAVEIVKSSWIWWTTHMCTGALIHKEWVLTTYTCANSKHFWNIRKYVVGRSKDNPEGMILKEKQVFWHEGYDKNTGLNNIALVKLEQPVPVESHPQMYGTAVMPPRVVAPEGTALLAGFGADSKLKTVDLEILRATDCKGFNNQTICTEKGKGACSGDDGSPLTVPVGPFWKLVGLAAGSMPCDQADKLGQYVDVAQFSFWVLPKILQNSS